MLAAARALAAAQLVDLKASSLKAKVRQQRTSMGEAEASLKQAQVVYDSAMRNRSMPAERARSADSAFKAAHANREEARKRLWAVCLTGDEAIILRAANELGDWVRKCKESNDELERLEEASLEALRSAAKAYEQRQKALCTCDQLRLTLQAWEQELAGMQCSRDRLFDLEIAVVDATHALTQTTAIRYPGWYGAFVLLDTDQLGLKVEDYFPQE